MCERYTILVRGDSRRMIGMSAVTEELFEVSITLSKAKGALPTLRVVDDGDVKPTERTVLAGPVALKVVRRPRLKKFFVVLVQQNVRFRHALQNVLRSAKCASELQRETTTTPSLQSLVKTKIGLRGTCAC